MNEELKAWVSQKAKQRGWSYRELARRAKISHSLISRTLSGDMTPSSDFCIKIAHALEEPPETVLRLAGIINSPPTSDNDSTLAELRDLVENLPPGQRREALRYLRYLYQAGQDEKQ